MLTKNYKKRAYIQRVSKLSPIENSDLFEKAEIESLGWKNVVVKKGEFEVGDRVACFESQDARFIAPWDLPIGRRENGEGILLVDFIAPAKFKKAGISTICIGTDLTTVLNDEVWDEAVTWNLSFHEED